MPSRLHSSSARGTLAARTLLTVVVTAIVAAGCALSVHAPAAALDGTESTSTATPSPSPSPDIPTEGLGPSLTVDPRGPVSALPLMLSGSRSAGAEVQVQPAGGGEPLCIAPASDETTWSCTVRSLPSGPEVGLRIVAIQDNQSSDESISVAWLNPPTITASPRPTTAGQVGGSAYPGARVEATVRETASTCSVTADTGGSWTCILSEPLPTGEYTVTARQFASFFPDGSAQSGTTAVMIDKDPPPVPRILQPGAGTALPLSGGRFSGSGEDGNTVLLFAGVHPLCQAPVSGGRWECSAAAVPEGEFSVNAVQLDPAGNASASSAAIMVRFSGSTPSPTATPSSPGRGSALPQADAAPLPQSPQQPPVAAPPVAESPTGPTRPVPRWVEDLSAPTALGGSLAPLAAVPGAQVATAFALSGGVFALLLVPGLLASRSLAGRMGRVPSFTGRNRGRADDRFARLSVDPRFIAVASLMGASVMVVLAHPVLAQANYLRLAVAVVLAIVTVNLLGTVAVATVARRVFGVDARIGTRSALLGVAAFTALLTRALGLAPPLAYGQVLGIDHDPDSPSRHRALVALAQTATLAGLALLAWLAYGTGPSSGGFAEQLIGEYTSTVVFAAAGAAAIGMVPLRSLPGGAMLTHSRWMWTATTIAAWAVLFLVLTAVTETGSATGLLAGAITSIAFAVLSLAAWAWVRFVEPALSR